MLTTQLAEASAARRCKINCHKIKFGCMPPMTKIINKNEAGSSLARNMCKQNEIIEKKKKKKKKPQ